MKRSRNEMTFYGAEMPADIVEMDTYIAEKRFAGVKSTLTALKSILRKKMQVSVH